MKSFLEKLIFQYLVYDHEHSSLFQRKIPVGFIYTVNVTRDQFDDYSKYVTPLFDEKKKRKVKEEQFPKDCQNAFDMGVRLVEQSHL